MPVKVLSVQNGKRKLDASLSLNDLNAASSKKKKLSTSAFVDPLREPHHSAQESEENGIVLRKYYPPEMSNARAQAYNDNEIERPIKVLESALADTLAARDKIDVKGAVVHWFKWDLRTGDNKALHLASLKSQKKGVPVIGLYVVSPQDFEAHLTSPARVDFVLRTLQVLREDLAKLDIPLWIETVEKRKAIPAKILDLLEEWEASHLFTNMEYEVDELRREAKLVQACLGRGIAMSVVHDTCVVPPGVLTTGTGKQYSVYTPWYRSWLVYLKSHDNLLDLFPAPAPNPPGARDKYAKLFENPIPFAPASKALTDEEKKRLRPVWPAGEAEAHARLAKFVAGRIGAYKESRNFPADAATSSLSVHFAAGTLSARTAVRTARDNNSRKLDGGSLGVQTWISEIAWRDFYKHVLVNWPFVCMNKPFKPEYTNITWSYSDADFKAWCTGRTGYPIVDAAMRQLLSIGWMHNRCRMIVASFLSKHLLIDWRMGERFFMEHLIDGDFASNNGGWGWSASTGVDPQPYFRIFNPLTQSEKFDADGEYIRRWVEELKDVKGKDIHDPYGRGAGKIAKKMGYPERVVEHKDARERCLTRYKEGLGRDKT